MGEEAGEKGYFFSGFAFSDYKEVGLLSLESVRCLFGGIVFCSLK